MDNDNEPKVTKERLSHLAQLAGLDLDDRRLEILVPQVQRFFFSIQRLGELSLGETEPAVIFTLREDLDDNAR